MSRVEIRRPWRSQPRSNADVNPDAEVLSRVDNSIILYGNDKNWKVNKGSRIASPVMTGVVAPGRTSGGEALLFNGVDTRLDFGTANIPTSEFTVVWGGTLNTIANFRGLADCINGGNGWTLFYSGTDTLWFSGNGYGGITNFSGWPTGVFHTGAFRYKSGVERAWFRNGRRLASEVDATSISTTIANFWIGSQRGGGSTNLDGSLNFFYLFDKSLSDGAIIKLLNSPYSLIEDRTLYVQTSTGGGAQTITGVVAVPTSIAGTPVLTVGAVTFSPPRPTPSSNASTPTLTAGGVTLSLSAAVASGSVSTPSLTNGNASITPSVAIASSNASTPTLTGSNTLGVTVPVPSSNASLPSLTAGAVALVPGTATATSNASVPTLQNGSSLAPAVAVVSSNASNPTLIAGTRSFSPPAPIASSNASNGTLVAGNVPVAPAAAVATSAGAVPDIASGSVLAPNAAIVTSSVASATLGVGVAPLVTLAASATGVGVTPSFVQSSFLVPAVAICGSVALVPQLFNSGAGHSIYRQIVIDVEQRLFTISAEGRLYTSPSELRTYS